MSTLMETIVFGKPPHKPSSRIRSRFHPRKPVQLNGSERRKTRRFSIDLNARKTETQKPKPQMRVLLRHAKTLKYVRANDEWTENAEKAQDFHSGWWATIRAFTMDPRNLMIFYKFDDDRYDLQIPVLGAQKNIRCETAAAH